MTTAPDPLATTIAPDPPSAKGDTRDPATDAPHVTLGPTQYRARCGCGRQGRPLVNGATGATEEDSRTTEGPTP